MSKYAENVAEALDQAAEIQRICDKRFGKGRAELEDLVRSNAASIVFFGRFRGQRAVFKLVREVQADETGPPLHGLREMLESFERAFAGQPYHVNPFLGGAVPWKGLIILGGRVPGRPVAEIFEEAMPSLGGAGNTGALWLVGCCPRVGR